MLITVNLLILLLALVLAFAAGAMMFVVYAWLRNNIAQPFL
jgi:zinc transporter ZupT